MKMKIKNIGIGPDEMHYSIEITDKLLYEFYDVNGKLNRFFITNPKYELLFDMGMCAYLKGFYREAVLDFAASPGNTFSLTSSCSALRIFLSRYIERHR